MSPPVQLALGTAQFGMAYGISGRGTAVPAAEIAQILDCAWQSDIRLLDTAPAYGDIEERLDAAAGGHAFSIVSKIPAWPAGADTAEVEGFVVSSIRRSRARLGGRLRTILFHRGEDLLSPCGATAWTAAAAETRDAGIRLGASCYSPATAARIKSRCPIAIAQFPGNALDQRLAAPSARDCLAGVEVHLRSVFLQGLLLMPLADAVRRVPAASNALAFWHRWCAENGLSPLAAALGAARSLPDVRYCVVGVDSLSQLEQIVAAWNDARRLDMAALASGDAAVIDPRRWRDAS